MEIALISDIHGNAPALDAVLRDIRRLGIERIICLGDVATLGPQPKKVIKRLRDLNCDLILGNHDAALVQGRAFGEYAISPSVFPALRWCREKLDHDELDFLASFKRILPVRMDADCGLLCFHGSPAANTDLILSTTPENEVRTLLGDYRAEIYAGGHTHIQMMRRIDDKQIINPGSVGFPFLSFPEAGAAPQILPWAEYAVLDCTAGDVIVEFRSVAYDLGEFRHLLAACDHPLKRWLLLQFTTNGKQE